MRLPIGLVACALVVGACSSRRAEPEAETTAPVPARVSDAAVLAPGVLAARRGENGEIRVEEQAGMRRLVIGEIVQGAVPIGADAGKTGPDPLVGVIRALRPAATTVLVIGLGTGTTTMDLRRAGFTVTVVELEPAVIEFARTYFGFTGEAIARDGARFLRQATATWDVVIMDAFLGMQAPHDLVGRRALARMRARTREGGLTMVRGLGEPRDHLFARIARNLGEGSERTFVTLFGSGVGAEPQNLYLIASDQPFNLVDTHALPVWPVRLAGHGPLWAEPTAVDGRRRVRLVGYVIRLPGGELALDLPHWEMGAARYLLAGDAAAPLADMLPAHARHPTAGDIASDGDTSSTLHAVLGGGGAKRSDVRFSPLAAIVEGRVSLVSLVDPDAAGALPASVRGDAATDPRLPYGGALYQLEVDRVDWTLSQAAWRRADKRAAGPIRAARARLRRAELGAAVEELARYLTVMAEVVPPTMPPHAEVARLATDIEDEADHLPGRLGPFALAAACDRLYSRARARGPVVSKNARTVVRALRECAFTRYERAAASPREPDAIPSAKRLVALYATADSDPLLEDDERRAAADKLVALRARYRVLRPSPEPPPRPLDPPAVPPE